MEINFFQVPRGATTLKLTGPESWNNVVLYGNRKFSGGIGDDDETNATDQQPWDKFFIADQENTKKIVSMEKLNGEAAHFSGR